MVIESGILDCQDISRDDVDHVFKTSLCFSMKKNIYMFLRSCRQPSTITPADSVYNCQVSIYVNQYWYIVSMQFCDDHAIVHVMMVLPWLSRCLCSSIYIFDSEPNLGGFLFFAGKNPLLMKDKNEFLPHFNAMIHWLNAGILQYSREYWMNVSHFSPVFVAHHCNVFVLKYNISLRP